MVVKQTAVGLQQETDNRRSSAEQPEFWPQDDQPLSVHKASSSHPSTSEVLSVTLYALSNINLTSYQKSLSYHSWKFLLDMDM